MTQLKKMASGLIRNCRLQEKHGVVAHTTQLGTMHRDGISSPIWRQQRIGSVESDYINGKEETRTITAIASRAQSAQFRENQ